MPTTRHVSQPSAPVPTDDRTGPPGGSSVLPSPAPGPSRPADADALVLPSANVPGSLTAREREVLGLIALGHTTAEIARRLQRSPKTVETHRKNISTKLGAPSRAELVRFALEQGLVNSSVVEPATATSSSARASESPTVFKACPACHAEWRSEASMLRDPDVRLIGFQLLSDGCQPGSCQSGVFVFSHETCGTSLAMETAAAVGLTHGSIPVLSRSACSVGRGGDHCLGARAGGECPRECICEFVWRVTRLIRDWPKDPSSARRLASGPASRPP